MTDLTTDGHSPWTRAPMNQRKTIENSMEMRQAFTAISHYFSTLALVFSLTVLLTMHLIFRRLFVSSKTCLQTIDLDSSLPIINFSWLAL